MPPTIHIPGQPPISTHLKHDDVLWRYVGAARFLDFRENSTLFFCRADNFTDKFEGAFTATLRKEIENSYLANGINFTYVQFKQRMRQTVIINCWHKDQDDNAAMWALYGKSECSVALTTTVGRLAESLAKANLHPGERLPMIDGHLADHCQQALTAVSSASPLVRFIADRHQASGCASALPA